MLGDAVLVQIGGQLRKAQILIGLEDQESTDSFAKPLIRIPNHGRHGDRRVLVEEVFDFNDRYVLAPSDDQVLGASGNADDNLHHPGRPDRRCRTSHPPRHC